MSFYQLPLRKQRRMRGLAEPGEHQSKPSRSCQNYCRLIACITGGHPSASLSLSGFSATPPRSHDQERASGTLHCSMHARQCFPCQIFHRDRRSEYYRMQCGISDRSWIGCALYQSQDFPCHAMPCHEIGITLAKLLEALRLVTAPHFSLHPRWTRSLGCSARS